MNLDLFDPFEVEFAKLSRSAPDTQTRRIKLTAGEMERFDKAVKSLKFPGEQLGQTLLRVIDEYQKALEGDADISL